MPFLAKLRTCGALLLSAACLQVHAAVGSDGTQARSDSGANVAKSRHIPSYFLGHFEDMVPKLIGGTVPETRFVIDCSVADGCSVAFGDGKPDRFEEITRTASLKAAQYALSYARSHRQVADTSPMFWQASNLKPLLDSNAKIESCLDLNGTATKSYGDQPVGSPAYFVLCKLNHNPWPKPVVLLFGMNMSTCGELFCGYEFSPAFKATDAAH